jgi:hypothetical protein
MSIPYEPMKKKNSRDYNFLIMTHEVCDLGGLGNLN